MGIFGNAFGWPHLILIVAVILLVFGATRLPALAKSVGQSMKIFKNEMKTNDDPKAQADAEASVTSQAAAPSETTTASSTSDSGTK
jgi:sec-independent protein translocase protein TatA